MANKLKKHKGKGAKKLTYIFISFFFIYINMQNDGM